MNSSIRHQSQTQPVFSSNDTQCSSDQPLQLESWIGDYASGGDAEEYRSSKLVNFQPIRSQNPHQLYLPLPFPNFLINPYDGEFTPYLDLSPASSVAEETDVPSSICPSLTQSPKVDKKTLRSRSTVLQKILETQDQMFSDISAVWRRKFPVECSITSPNPAEASPRQSD